VIDSSYAMLALGEVETVAGVAISGFLYFVPTVIAVSRRAPNAVSVFGVNLLLGWTGIGWLVALFMSVGSDERSKPGPMFTHIGTRYRFGYSFEPPSYCIWDNDHPGPPVERFPYTEHGKDEALDRFRTLEPEASDVRRKPETA
jgi:Superinfection immunity protein